MRGPFGNRVQPSQSATERGGGASSQTAADFVVRFSEVVNSTLNNRTRAVQFAVTGIEGESVDDAEPYTSPGIVGRPLPPRYGRANGEQHMDTVCIITADGLTPIAFRDPRLKIGGDGPGVGVLAFVGYGGGFHSLSPVVDPNPPPSEATNPDPSGGGTIHTIYCPYDFDDDGNAQKAHAIIMDPTQGNESISIIHADGMALTMLSGGKNAIVMKNAAGDATLRLDDDGCTITAQRIVLSGGVIIGEPANAVPLLPGAASPGSTKLFVSP